MSKKTLKFNNIILNKKKFRKSKEPIDLLSVDLDLIVVSYKFKNNGIVSPLKLGEGGFLFLKFGQRGGL